MTRWKWLCFNGRNGCRVLALRWANWIFVIYRTYPIQSKIWCLWMQAFVWWPQFSPLCEFHLRRARGRSTIHGVNREREILYCTKDARNERHELRNSDRWKNGTKIDFRLGIQRSLKFDYFTFCSKIEKWEKPLERSDGWSYAMCNVGLNFASKRTARIPQMWKNNEIPQSPLHTGPAT